MEHGDTLKLKEYAQKKHELLSSIYDITKRSEFLGERSEIDRFVEYLNIREPYYKQLNELNELSNGALNNFQPDFESSDLIYREVSQILSEAHSLKLKIIEIDKRNNENMQKLTDSLRVEMRQINMSKKARNSYNFFQMQAHDDM